MASSWRTRMPGDQTTGRIPRLNAVQRALPRGSAAEQRRSDGERSRAVGSDRQNGFRLRDHFACYDDSADFDNRPSATDASAGLISLGFIGSALRRGMLVWLALAVIGLVLGVGLREAHARPLGDYHGAAGQFLRAVVRAASCKLTPLCAEHPGRGGRRRATAAYGRRPPAFSGRTPFAGTTPTILTITAKGPSDDAAVQRAAAIATQFLAFRAKYLQEQLQQTIDSAQPAGQPGSAAP